MNIDFCMGFSCFLFATNVRNWEHEKQREARIDRIDHSDWLRNLRCYWFTTPTIPHHSPKHPCWMKEHNCYFLRRKWNICGNVWAKPKPWENWRNWNGQKWPPQISCHVWENNLTGFAHYTFWFRQGRTSRFATLPLSANYFGQALMI